MIWVAVLTVAAIYGLHVFLELYEREECIKKGHRWTTHFNATGEKALACSRCGAFAGEEDR